MGVTLLVFGGIFYFMFISEYFRIASVVISGTSTIPEEQIFSRANDILERKKFGLLNAQNYFLFSSSDLKASIMKEFPKVSSIEVKKISPDKLEIAIGERKSIGVWCGEDCYYLDKGGIIFEESPKTTGSLMLSIYDDRDSSYSIGQQALKEDEISFFQNIHTIVAHNFSFGVRKFIILKDGEFELLTSEGWLIILDKKESPEYQLSNLKYVLDEEIKTRITELEYVDLRLGNRVYYKYENNAKVID